MKSVVLHKKREPKPPLYAHHLLEQVPLLLECRIGTIGLHRTKALVDQIKQRLVAFLHRNGDILLGERLAGNHQFILVIVIGQYEVTGDERIADRCIDISIEQILNGKPDVVISTPLD